MSDIEFEDDSGESEESGEDSLGINSEAGTNPYKYEPLDESGPGKEQPLPSTGQVGVSQYLARLPLRLRVVYETGLPRIGSNMCNW